MKKKHSSINFIVLELCIVLMYLVSLCAAILLAESTIVFPIAMIGILTLLVIAGLAVCMKTSNRVNKTDSLTGIGNADWIMAKGGKLHAQKKLSRYTAVFLNIKDSKYMNEKFGSDVGDEIIHDYAQKLNSYLRKKGYIGRLGGDNFCIYIKNDYLDEFINYLNHISFAIPTEAGSVQYQVKARCGFFRVTEDTKYPDVMNHASAAMAVAKETGTDLAEYSSAMQDAYFAEKQILADLNNALENEEFVAYYQPKVDSGTHRLCGAEALVRWIKDGEVRSPGMFVPVLEKYNKISMLDFYIFEHVCKDLRQWLDMGLEPVCVSSNFSRQNLKNENFAEDIISIMNQYALDGRYIEIELTESSCTEDLQLLKQFVGKIKRAGIRLAIDDFGTGYSSLSMLHEFDADVVKLDKSFLDSAIEGNDRSKVFIRDVIRMVDDMDEATLCEGVETKEQLEFLKEAGCKMIQGYYFDKPLPHDTFEKRLEKPQYSI